MTATLILMGGMALFATIFVIIDEIGRRQKRVHDEETQRRADA